GDKLLELYQSGNLPGTVKVNSPTSLLGHETVHAFNFLRSSIDHRNRRNSGPVEEGGMKFRNQEEARTTTLSRQININLGENPRNNHEGMSVPTQGVKSNIIKE